MITCVIFWINVLRLNHGNFVLRYAKMYLSDFILFGLLTQSWLGIFKTNENCLSNKKKERSVIKKGRIKLHR
jgi:hypothetical protein